MTPLQAAIVGRARGYVGVKETAPNSGPEIDGWLMVVHALPGDPWCGAFASCVVLEGADDLGVGISFHPSASTQRLWMANVPLQIHGEPQPGDLYVLRHTANTGHVGIVEIVENGAVASEISGNSWSGATGGREGNCVARHFGPPEKSHGGVLLGYLRPIQST